MENAKKSRLNCEKKGKYGRIVNWIANWFGKFRRKVSRIVKRFGKYGRKWSWKVKRYDKKYGGKDIENMEEKNVE